MKHIIEIDQSGIDLMKSMEGCILHPYLDKAGIATIGIGSTYYENGSKVKISDPSITLDRAISLFKHTLITYERAVDSYTRDDINQNMFNALVDFTYNEGTGALKSSTLLKKVNVNPNDPNIRVEFMKWVKVRNPHTHELETDDWQVKRRGLDANMYFKLIL